MADARRVTLRDVAKRLGVSVNTVSRALSNKDQVSESTRATIVAEARRLGYVPNSHARSLVSGTSHVVGLVITNPSNPFYATLISAVERQCRDAGYSVLLLVTGESEEDENDTIQQLLRFGVDGALAVPTQSGNGTWNRLAEAGIPVILVSRDLPELDFDFVGIDAEQGLAKAVTQTVTHRVERAWLLEEDLDISTVTSRIAGFHEGLATAGISAERSLVIKVPTRRERGASLPWRPDDAYRMATNLITQDNHPELIITGNDYFALGLYRASRELGLTIPTDLMIMGYGDHPFAAYLEPPLTTLQLPADEVGNVAVAYLLERLAEPSAPRKQRLLLPELQERSSTQITTPAGQEQSSN